MYPRYFWCAYAPDAMQARPMRANPRLKPFTSETPQIRCPEIPDFDQKNWGHT